MTEVERPRRRRRDRDAEDDDAENEVDDVSDEGPAEVVDMDEEDDTARQHADAEEKGE